MKHKARPVPPISLLRMVAVGGIVGLAADPDFTENLLMRYLPKAKIAEIYDKGVATIAWGEVIPEFRLLSRLPFLSFAWFCLKLG